MSQPSFPQSATWKVVIFRVTDEDRLQRVLRAFHRMNRPGVCALGSHSGEEQFVIVECPSADAETHVRRIILTLDPYAVETHSTTARTG